MLKIHHKKSIIIPTIAIAAVLVAGGGWYAYGMQHKDSSDNKSHSKSQDDSNKSDDKDNNQSKDNDSGATTPKDSSDTSSTPAASSSVQPSNPVGTFVSNHYPNLSGSPAPNTESSTCSTTAGVQCQIRFTKGSLIKSLPAKTTDSNGNVSWNWTLQSAGLSSGTWKISAVATNGDKTAVAYDALNLVVKP